MDAGMVELDDKRSASFGAEISIFFQSACLNSGFSGPHSCTKSAFATAFELSFSNSKAPVGTAAKPIASSAGTAPAITSLTFRSISGSGSLMVTFRPLAKNRAAQEAPITPPPMTTACFPAKGLSEVTSRMLISSNERLLRTVSTNKIRDQFSIAQLRPTYRPAVGPGIPRAGYRQRDMGDAAQPSRRRFARDFANWPHRTRLLPSRLNGVTKKSLDFSALKSQIDDDARLFSRKSRLHGSPIRGTAEFLLRGLPSCLR